MMKLTTTILSLILSLNLLAQSAATVNDTLISVHDPVIIQQDSNYYIFCTGPGITAFASKDRKHWKQLNPVFDKAPA